MFIRYLQVIEGLKREVWYPGILQSPIHQAAYMGQNEILQIFLDAGANVNSYVNYPGKPPNKFTVRQLLGIERYI